MHISRKLLKIFLLPLVFFFTQPALSDEVINDDLIVTGDACIGADCVDGEEFAFLGVKIKNIEPQILFDDTSAGTFPANNWAIGITDNALAGPASFFIRDATAGSNVLVLEPGASGGIALGSGSVIEANAISVGTIGAERRIMHVADGVEDTDAINKAQLETDLSTLTATVEARIDALETQSSELSAPLNSRIDSINTRISELLDRINKL
jgi:hypothetical protein